MPSTISTEMNAQNQQAEQGLVSPAIVAVVVLSLAVVGLGVFGAWAYNNYVDQRDNVNQKVNLAVTAAKQAQSVADAAKYDQAAKLPTLKFTGPSDLGSVTFNYPKTWSGYIYNNGSGGNFEAYFQPGIIPPVSGTTPFALRVSILGSSYTSVVTSLQNQIKAGKLTAESFTAGGEVGLKVAGQISSNIKDGEMVVMKIRDQTLELYTQSPTYKSDFETIVLPSLNFSR